MAKIFYYDVETTGLDHKKASIHQLSGAIEIDGVIVNEFDYRIKPLDKGSESVFENEKWVRKYFNKEHSDYALEMAGATLEELQQRGREPREVMNELLAVMAKYVNQYDKNDKLFLCGYNNRRFDDNVFRQWFSDLEYKWFGSWYWNDTLDALVLASYSLMEERPRLNDFKLATVARHLGLEVDDSKLHDSMYDIYLTIGIMGKIKERNASTENNT
jgi:DNA polymerase III subunit epsilon